MNGIKVDVKSLMKHAEAETVKKLSSILAEKNIAISGRTFYRWQKGVGFATPKFMKVIEALGYEDPISLLSIIEVDLVADAIRQAIEDGCIELEDEE